MSDSRRCYECGNKYKIATHQVGDQAWLCERCFRDREREKRAPFIDWSTRESVDSLSEAMHYFAELYRHRDYRTLELVDRMNGIKGVICNVLEMVRDTTDPLGSPWTKYHLYFQLFNRRYLERGEMLFERASMMRGKWQTVRKNVVDKAAAFYSEGKFKNNVSIVIVMQDKTVWYINPVLMQTFAYEYETYNTTEGVDGCSVPITKEKIISRTDPFFL